MIRSIIALCLIGFFLGSCRENQPEYTLIKPEASERTIVVEEFSGARCPNCPQGTQELENLRSIYGENLIIVTIHAGDFAFKYNESAYDFTTQEGNALLDYLGNPVGYPSAVINRKPDDASQSFQYFSTKWSSLISEELSVPAKLDIEMKVSFDTDSRLALITVDVLPTEDINDPLYVSVLLKESEIIDPQADRAASSGIVLDYIHKNVLRVMLSEVKGDKVADEGRAFERVTKEYQYQLPPEEGWWKAENISVVGFVTTDAPRILQAREEKLLP